MEVADGQIEAMRSRVADAMDQLDRLRAGYADLHRELQEVSASVTSDDGLVTVTVGPQGRVVQLTLEPGIYRRPDSRRLADIIMSTIARAADDAQDQVLRLCQPLMPDAETKAHLNNDLAGVLRVAEERLEGGGARWPTPI